MTKQPFDLLRGAWIILLIIVAGSLLLSIGIEAGCVLKIPDLCNRGSGIADIMGQVVAIIALMLGARRPPPAPPSDEEQP